MKKKWESREWWEKRAWTEADVEAMWKEEKARLSKLPWFESGKPARTTVFWERDWEEEQERSWERAAGPAERPAV